MANEQIVGQLHRKAGAWKKLQPFIYLKEGIYLKEFDLNSHFDTDLPRRVYDISGGKLSEPASGNISITFIVKLRNKKAITFVAPSFEEKKKWMKGLINPVEPVQFHSCAAIIAPVRRRQSSITNTMRKKNLKSTGEIITDATGMIVEVDKGAPLMFSYAKEDLVGQKMNMLFTLESATHYVETFNAFVEETKNENKPPRIKNLKAVRRNQEEFSAAVSMEKMKENTFKHRILDRSSTMFETQKDFDSFKMIATLRLDIMEGHSLGPSNASPYCVISIDGSEKTSTSIKHSTDSPFWGEEFLFEDIKPTQRQIQISINNNNSHDRDPRIGEISLNILELSQTGRMVDEWVNVNMINHTEREGPSIRIKASLTVEKILPYKEYKELLDLFMDEKLVCASALAKVANTQLDDVAGTLVNIFAMKNRVTDFVRTLASIEIGKTDRGNILFRGNSLGTKVIDQYMKMVGFDYLQRTLGNVIDEVVADKESCEVDPTRVAKGEDIKKNQKRLIAYTQKFFETIVASISHCPAEMKMVFSNLREEVGKKFQGTERHCAVSGFIFLRLFCPAILNPKMFGMTKEHPEGTQARTLTLIAKAIQNLANLVPQAKEKFMEFMESFLESNLKAMEDCVTDFSTPPEGIFEFSGTGSSLDLSREMCALFRHCQEATESLETLAEQTGEPKLHTLFEIMSKLEKKQIEHERKNLGHIKNNPVLTQKTISLTGIDE